MSKTLDEFQAEIGAWGDETFPKSTTASILAHLGEELDELDCDEFAGGNDSEEAADCFLLILQYAHKRGFSLYEAAERKMAINRTRKWTVDAGTHTKHAEESPS